MKKLLIALFLLLTVAAFAIESAPSAVVGYYKMDIAPGGWAPFSQPFGSSTAINSVFASGNAFDQDIILDMTTGENATYYSLDNYGWDGMTDILPGHAYWYYRDVAQTASAFYLMGSVNPSPVTTNLVAMGWTAFSLNTVNDVAITDLGIPVISDQDIILDMTTGENATYYSLDNYGWDGMTTLVPTHTYWYLSNSGSDVQWTYTPGNVSKSKAINTRSARVNKNSK